MPASTVVAVDFGPAPTVTRASFDSDTGEWTFVVTRPIRRPVHPTRREDVPIAVRDALREFAGALTKVGPA